MRIDHLWLRDYRNYVEADLEPSREGLTVVSGPNGHGKTNLLESISWLATLRSFRGAPAEALVRRGSERAVLRAEVTQGRRQVLVEAELSSAGRPRAQVNRQGLRRSRDLLGVLRASVFSPDDLVLVKGGPAERRRLLDDALVSLHPANDALRADLERVLRQRSALLHQAGGRATPDVLTTLDVWDAQLARLGTLFLERRVDLVSRLAPEVERAYDGLAGGSHFPSLRYEPSWVGDLASALAAARAEDLRRAATTVGPHRDELVLSLSGMPARTHASQGEQRCLALALRLAVHAVLAGELGEDPVLLLDDVFSELDESRSAALLALLPPGQALLTTVGPLPAGAEPSQVVEVASGRLRAGLSGQRVSSPT